MIKVLLLLLLICSASASEFRTWSGTDGNLTNREQDFIISDAQKWQAVWNGMMRQADDAPQVDFNSVKLLAVFLSQKPTSGYFLNLEDVKTGYATKNITLRYFEPCLDEVILTTYNSPYFIMELPADNSVNLNIVKEFPTCYRLYNPHSGKHHWTTDENEYRVLDSLGWNAEGAQYKVCSRQRSAADKNGTANISSRPHYRLYNKHAAKHHWTLDANEYSTLQRLGWNGEGISSYLFNEAFSVANGTQALYRLYNPHNGKHFFTVDQHEYNVLETLGWIKEDVSAWVIPKN